MTTMAVFRRSDEPTEAQIKAGNYASLSSISLSPSSLSALRVSSTFCSDTPPSGAISIFTVTRRPVPVANLESTRV